MFLLNSKSEKGMYFPSLFTTKKNERKLVSPSSVSGIIK